jgi:ATP-binding cassette subfamily B (MDR/TAP) protein 1
VAEEWDEEELRFENEKRVVEMSGSRAIGSREKGVRRHWDNVEIHPKNDAKYEQEDQFQRPAFWGILREIYPTIPYKPLLFLGLFICLANGAMTPVFSFLLSHLLFEVSTGAHNVSTINFFGGLVLGVAAFDGLLMGFKYFLMETAGNAWVLRIRRQGFANVLAQEKKWFDKRENTSVRLVQTLVKDGDDARNLVAVVMGEGCVVVAMVGVGLLWAMVRGWQLTLVGVGVAPVFAGMMALQAALVAKCELRNKRAREEVAKGYYDVSFLLLLFCVDADNLFNRRS